MKKILCIIILFILVLSLTGCSSKNIDNNVKNKRIEQINLLDIKYFTLYQFLSGIQIDKEKLIVETEEMSDEQQKTHNSQEENDKENGTYRFTEIISENNLINEVIEPNWDLALQYFYEIQNVVYDIQVEIKYQGNDTNITMKYQKELDELMNNMIKKDKKESILTLQRLYYYSEYFLQNYIKDDKLYAVKKAYYDTITCLIYSELDMQEEYARLINDINEDIKKINELIKEDETIYIIERLNVIILNIKEDEIKENRRLKLVMLIETIPTLEKHITNKFDKA